jgi:hypothetical protein
LSAKKAFEFLASFFGLWNDAGRGKLAMFLLPEDRGSLSMYPLDESIDESLRVSGSCDGVHRLHWRNGSGVLYLVNTDVNGQLSKLFPPKKQRTE